MDVTPVTSRCVPSSSSRRAEGRAGSRNRRPAGSTSNCDPAKPWGTVFAMVVADKEWWNANLHRPASLYRTRIKSAATAVEDGIAQPALERSVARTAMGGKNPGPLTRLAQATTSPWNLWIGLKRLRMP